MQINQTVRKIEKILKSKYDTNNYVDFIREIFPTVKIIAPDRFRKEYTNFSSHIEGSIHVGNYIDPDGKKLIIHAVQLVKESYVENSRSTQRSYAKKLMEAGNADAAIIAFYTKGDPKWRLSYVRLDYEIKLENGKLNTTENMTPAKRYSYLVGEDEPSHTAISRFYRFITDDPNTAQPTLDDLEEAFSVEKVTDEFFQLYCEKFHQLREALESNPDFVIEAEQHNFTSEQFAKKLMGQIVFLYFLQKKGWLGVKAWPRELDEKGYKNAFFSRGAKSRELIPKVYIKVEDNKYMLSGKAIKALSDDDECVLATCVKGQPWGSGSHKFMRELFEFSHKRKANFFDDYLEPLFYDALNVNRGEQGYDPALHCRIPFLSGGLFEPIDGYDWKHNDFAIPNEVFSNIAEKGERDADGILDIFDRYNFTMSEDEPLEREVAIDPEMLGKVFENLLEIRDRKSKGAFYTPREIVHFMCQETLIQYLVKETGLKEQDIRDFILLGDFLKDEDTSKDKRLGSNDMLISEEIFRIDKEGKVVVDRLRDIDYALSNIRVADPAVGSGAFPLGMLNEIVRARQNISAYMAITMNPYETRMMYNNERSPYNLKLQTIKNCIFAADIEPSAVDIAQLRLWLSLVIDDEINPNAQSPLDGHRNPIPLPNLECNIVCGNSLIDEFEGFQLVNHSDIIATNIGAQQNLFQSTFDAILPHLIDAQNSLFRCEDTSKKQELKDTIESLKDEIVKSQLRMANQGTWKRYLDARREASRPFVLWQIDFARVFKEKGGFDIVVGNPPYVGEEGHKEMFQAIASTNFGKKYYTGKMDFWYFFTSKGLELIRQNGQISFIAPNNWMTTAGGKRMRKHIAEEGRIQSFVTFNNVMIFESASQQTMIFRIEKERIRKPYKLRYKEVGNQKLNAQELTAFLTTNSIGTTYMAGYDPIENADGRTIQFLNTEALDVIEKIRSGKRLFLSNNEIINGIHPHHAEVTKKMLPLLPNANIGDGIFILKSHEIKKLSIPEDERGLLHPYYDSNSIGRYYFDPTVRAEIIYTTSDFKDTNKMKRYPTLKKHLDKYVKVITSDNRPYGLHRARKQEFFENPKICSLRKCPIPVFSYVKEPSYVTAEWYLIQTYRINMKYLTTVLNSKLIKFWLLKMGKMQGSIYQVDKDPLVKIPIAYADKETQKSLINLYNEIVTIKASQGKDGDTSHLERDVDDLVYKAYGLNEEDIRMIEESIYAWENAGKKQK